MKYLLGLCLLAGFCYLITEPVSLTARADEATGDPSDPVASFEYLWNSLDRTYAQFETKHVDWDALYRVYRPRVTHQTTESGLWDIMLEMMGHLNDTHVCLSDATRRECVGIVDELTRDDFSLDLVMTRYLDGDTTTALGGSFTYGWLTEGVAYLHIGDFKDPMDETVEAIDAVIDKFAGAEGMIVDVRYNPGGTGAVAARVADRFADRRRHFMTSQIRYGKSHGDFDSPAYWNVSPGGPVQFTGPTLLLTHRFSESAADIFALAMRVLPHVTLVGDFTAGAFSAQFPDRLPNGWRLWVAFKLLKDHEGICWDGIGVPPDLRIKNTRADIDAGTDRVLEFAVELLDRGGLKPQDEAASLRDIKTSLVDDFARNAEEVGPEAARAALDEAITSGNDRYFLSADEIMQLSRNYMQAGKTEELITILEVCRAEFPQLSHTYSVLARTYLGIGDVEAAKEAIEACESVEPMFPWEPVELERAKIAILKEVQGSAAALVEQALAEGGIDKARKTFEEALASGDAGPVFEERDFNLLGYRLMQDGDLESAIFVFSKNVELYPGSSNVYDSLGEAFMKAGEKDLAIENYRRSLALDPGNGNARSMLDELEGEG